MNISRPDKQSRLSAYFRLFISSLLLLSFTLILTPIAWSETNETNLDVPLNPAWNSLDYPLSEAQPVSDALLSIDGYYSILWEANLAEPVEDRWSFYCDNDVTLCPYLDGELTNLTYDHSYWIKVSEAVTVVFDTENTPPITDEMNTPPSVFYGMLSSQAGVIYVGGTVDAYIGRTLCGTAEMFAHEDGIAYQIEVQSDDMIEGCGVNGSEITFMHGDVLMNPDTVWTFGELTMLPLEAVVPTAVTLTTLTETNPPYLLIGVITTLIGVTYGVTLRRKYKH